MIGCLTDRQRSAHYVRVGAQAFIQRPLSRLGLADDVVIAQRIQAPGDIQQLAAGIEAAVRFPGHLAYTLQMLLNAAPQFFSRRDGDPRPQVVAA